MTDPLPDPLTHAHLQPGETLPEYAQRLDVEVAALPELRANLLALQGRIALAEACEAQQTLLLGVAQGGRTSQIHLENCTFAGPMSADYASPPDHIHAEGNAVVETPPPLPPQEAQEPPRRPRPRPAEPPPPAPGAQDPLRSDMDRVLDWVESLPVGRSVTVTDAARETGVLESTTGTYLRGIAAKGTFGFHEIEGTGRPGVLARYTRRRAGEAGPVHGEESPPPEAPDPDPQGWPPPQTQRARLLDEVRRMPGLTAREYAAALGINPNSAASALSGLVQSGALRAQGEFPARYSPAGGVSAHAPDAPGPESAPQAPPVAPPPPEAPSAPDPDTRERVLGALRKLGRPVIEAHLLGKVGGMALPELRAVLKDLEADALAGQRDGKWASG